MDLLEMLEDFQEEIGILYTCVEGAAGALSHYSGKTNEAIAEELQRQMRKTSNKYDKLYSAIVEGQDHFLFGTAP